ncbi:transposable element Tcb1 transposase [Trichonephila clavipes]|nr:transposable element Tcb1 transposase [Trichonephila clavipes]
MRICHRWMLRLSSFENHRHVCCQCYDERQTWTTEWNDIVFTDEFYFCLQYHDCRFRVWRSHGERLLKCCIIHRLTGPAPDIMVGVVLDFTAAPL